MYTLTKLLFNSLFIGDGISVDRIENRIDQLYELAVRNKVDLLFLKTLDKIHGLDDRYRKRLVERENQRFEMIITANKIIGILEDLGYNASTFKSFTPFPIVPNDIDVIILDPITGEEFNHVVKRLIENYNYMVFDKIPYAVTLHDSRGGPHLDPRFKDPYDIDLYVEIAANNLIYLDKRCIEGKTRIVRINGYDIKTLDPMYELVVQCIHSIIPEQIYLLYHFLTITSLIRLEGVKGLNEIADHLNIARELSLCLSITSHILETLTNEHGYRSTYAVEFFDKGYYKVKIPELFLILVARSLRDTMFRNTLLDQLRSMMNSENLAHVIKNLIERRIRETY